VGDSENTVDGSAGGHGPACAAGAESAVARVPGGEAGAVLSAVAAGIDAAEAAVRSSARRWTPDEWLALVGGSQELLNRMTALQHVAMARAVRFEPVWQEDGSQGWTEHGPGRVALGGVDLVAARTGDSHHQARRRVELAVRLEGCEPRDTDDLERPERTGLGGLRDAMREGVLDGYRASVVADELEGCPPDVAQAVVSALSPHLAEEPAAGLRRRTRRMLARISPHLLRQRVERARAETGLRRWVDVPGVDVWMGRFPSESSATAWAAIDALARRYVREGICATVEEARARALTDLVTGQADVEVEVVLTVPAAAMTLADERGGNPTAEAIGATVKPAGPTGGATGATAGAAVVTVAAGEVTGATARPAVATWAAGGSTGATPSADLAEDPPQSGAAPATAEAGALPRPSGGGVEAPVSTAPPRADDLVQVQGSRPGEPALVPRGWLASHLGPPGDAPKATCDAASGARVDPAGALSSAAYRPGSGLAAHVRARDGRCRFPGCSVAARFCDIDHVRPWPGGPTAAGNLICLCRRHHRTKQLPGWVVRLQADGSAVWTDPAGAVRTTCAVDALDAVVLPAELVPSEALVVSASSVARAELPSASCEGPAEMSSASCEGAAEMSSASCEGAAELPSAPPASEALLPSVVEERLDWRLHEHDVLLRHRRGRAHAATRSEAARPRAPAVAVVPEPPPF
jgi:hypothetical protein